MSKKSLFLIASVSAIFWLVATPNPASGQGNTWAGRNLEQSIETARWRLGALRVNAAFDLRNVGYDSDIYSGYFAETVPDYTFSASAPVQVLLPLRKEVVLEIFDSPQYVFYLDTPKERAWNNSFRGLIHFAQKRLYFQAGGSLSSIRQHLSHELTANIRQKEDGLNGLVLWQASREASLALLYRRADYRYGDSEYGGGDIAEWLNRNVNYFDFITYLQPNPRVRYYVDGQYATYNFTEASSAFKDSRSYGVFGGLELTPRVGELLQAAGVRGTIRLGYMRFDMNDPQYIDGSGFVGQVEVSVGFLKKTEGRAFFSRGFQFSAYSNATYYLSSSFGGGVSRRVSRKIKISYDLSFYRSSYPVGETGGSSSPQGYYNRYSAHVFSLDIRLARYLGIGFSGTIGKRKRVGSGQVRDLGFFGFNLIYGVPTGAMSAPARSLYR